MAAEEAARDKKREAEKERQKIKGQIEMEQERQREREEIRLVRQQEAQERQATGAMHKSRKLC